jgi:hypothetical protein
MIYEVLGANIRFIYRIVKEKGDGMHQELSITPEIKTKKLYFWWE